MKGGDALLGSIIDVATAALPLIVPGSDKAIDLGKNILTMIGEAQTVLDAKDIGQLTAIREDVEERVNAHVNETVDKLRGDA